MKKLMSLGGNYFQMTLVKAAKRLGYYVIDVDYLPDNPAHKYADEYHNISTLDREKVLELAKKLKIDGIVSYASDVSAPTAAYVAEKLDLPTNPLESVEIMTHKDRFRTFLNENKFSSNKSAKIFSVSDLKHFYKECNNTIMLKPLHSSGSKGVSKLDSLDNLADAYEEATKYARGEHLWAEEFVQRAGYQVAGDAFLVDGKIRFFGLANEHFDLLDNGLTGLVPTGESFPCCISMDMKEKAKTAVENVLQRLNMKNGAINLDFMFDNKGDVFIIELGPRNGGNLITDAIALSSGVDLAEYTAKAAVGDDISDLTEQPMKRYISSYIVHTMKEGIYHDLRIADNFPGKVLRQDMFIQKGEVMHPFTNGGYGLGAMLLEFTNQEQMLYCMDHMTDYIYVI